MFASEPGAPMGLRPAVEVLREFDEAVERGRSVVLERVKPPTAPQSWKKDDGGIAPNRPARGVQLRGKPKKTY